MGSLASKLKLCCCFGICDSNAKVIEERKEFMVDIRKYSQPRLLPYSSFLFGPMKLEATEEVYISKSQ